MKYFNLRYVFVTFIFICVFNLSAQKSKDSLEALLPASSGIERLKIIDRLLVYTIYNDLDTSCYYANEILTGARKHENKKYESLAYSWLTVYNFLEGNYYKAEDYISRAIKIQKEINDTVDLGNSYINLMMVYAETDRYEEAVETAFLALKEFKSVGYKRGIVVSNGNIGIMYSKLEEYDKAVEYLNKTLQYMNRFNEFSNLGELYNNMGLAFYHLNSNDSAMFYFKKAISRFVSSNEKKGIAKAYLNIGNTYSFNLKNYDFALIYYDSALIFLEDAIEGLRTKIYSNTGKTYSAMGSYDKAIAMLNRSLELAIKNKELDEQRDNYYELCKVYQSKNMLSQAIDYCKKYNSVKDSIGIADAKVRIANLEAKFENKKNILTISKMKLEQEAKKSAHILSLAGSGLIILILIIIIISYSHKRKRGTLERKLLTADNDKLEDKLKFKSKQLTSQVLMMMHKNKQLNDILKSLSVIKCSQPESKSELSKIRQQITRSIHSEEDWDLFHHYFEDVNGNFFPKLYLINNNLTPAELKLSALIKLKFSIKESASLLNISPNSVKTTRYLLRKKLGLSKGDSIYDFLGEI